MEQQQQPTPTDTTPTLRVVADAPPKTRGNGKKESQDANADLLSKAEQHEAIRRRKRGSWLVVAAAVLAIVGLVQTGIAWYWALLLVAAVAGPVVWLLLRRNQKDKQAAKDRATSKHDRSGEGRRAGPATAKPGVGRGQAGPGTRTGAAKPGMLGAGKNGAAKPGMSGAGRGGAARLGGGKAGAGMAARSGGAGKPGMGKPGGAGKQSSLGRLGQKLGMSGAGKNGAAKPGMSGAGRGGAARLGGGKAGAGMAARSGGAAKPGTGRSSTGRGIGSGGSMKPGGTGGSGGTGARPGPMGRAWNATKNGADRAADRLGFKKDTGTDTTESDDDASKGAWWKKARRRTANGAVWAAGWAGKGWRGAKSGTHRAWCAGTGWFTKRGTGTVEGEYVDTDTGAAPAGSTGSTGSGGTGGFFDDLFTGTASASTTPPGSSSSPDGSASVIPDALSNKGFVSAVPVKANKPPKQSRTFTVPAQQTSYTPTAQETVKGGAVSHQATQGTVEAAGQMASYKPESLTDIVKVGHSAPQALSSVAAAFNNMASHLESTPAAAQADQYRQIAAQVAAAASTATETGAFIEANHSDDLKRIHQPRPNEAMADYSRNQG